MKKITYNILAICTVILCLTSLVSCAGSATNTASGKALEMTGFIQDEDYKSYAADVYSKNKITDDEIDQLALMLKMVGAGALEKRQGIKSYELISEEISDDGNSAIVMVKIEYGNGSVEEDKMRMIKDDSGAWKHKMR